MKLTNWIILGLLAGVLALSGCSKAPQAQDEVDVNGVKVAMPALQKSLGASTDKEVLGSLSKMAYGLRYRDYAGVQTALAQVAANPSLTEDQKKLVAKVDDQMKQVVAKAAAAPTQ